MKYLKIYLEEDGFWYLMIYDWVCPDRFYTPDEAFTRAMLMYHADLESRY